MEKIEKVVENAEKVIEIKGLKKLYSNGRGIENVTFDINRGDVVGLLGPNGSGKTTTMKVVCGMCVADSGEVKIRGKAIDENHEEAMENVGALIEMPALYEYMTAYQNLKMMSRFYKNVDDVRIDYIMKLLNIERYRNDKVGRFSLGMKQRLGLAMALISEPEIVVLDEPANGLDIEGIIHVREIITQMAKKGVTFLVSSHIASELEKTCNKVAVIHEGEMLSFDTMEEALKFSPTLEDYFLNIVKEKRGSLVI
ncbi:MAG: ABC transporter ATP-binding protein [Oscillospiraceae bacterium]